jgi:RNA polymerase-binding transcription factor DksA
MKASRKKTAKSRPRATTAALLGPPDPVRVPARWEKHYRRLLAVRERLRAESGDLLESSINRRTVGHSHRADDGIAADERELAAELISSETDALLEIESALRRIAEGTYGICQLTGERIPARRLNAIPWTAYTAEAQTEIESRKV